MKSFKLQKSVKTRTQLRWASALLVIICLVIIGFKVYYWFTYPDTPQVVKELGFSPKAFFSKEIIIFIALAAFGLITLLTTMFANGINHKE